MFTTTTLTADVVARAFTRAAAPVSQRQLRRGGAAALSAAAAGASAGACYAAAYAMMFADACRDSDGVRLCHAVVRYRGEGGGTMGHAWVERRDARGDWHCYDGRFPDVPIQRDAYYAAGDVAPDRVRRYSWFDVRRHARASGHTGPWDAEVRAASHADDDVAAAEGGAP